MKKSHVRSVFRENGQRFTKSREDMIEIFLKNSTSHFTIEELIELLSEDQHVNVATVYNNLSSFVETGIVTEFNFKNKKHYELTQQLHGHFVCKNCGVIFNVDIPGLECLNMSIYNKYKAVVFNKVIEFEGCCQECQENNVCGDCNVNCKSGDFDDQYN